MFPLACITSTLQCTDLYYVFTDLYYDFTDLYYVYTAVHRLVLRLELQKTAARPKPLIFHLVTDSQQTKW